MNTEFVLQELSADAPVHVLLPGLTGGSDDTYVRFAAEYAESHGMRSVVFNSRGCGDTMLTTPQFYSALFIGDLEQVVAHVRQLYPRSQLFATGALARRRLRQERHCIPAAIHVALPAPLACCLDSHTCACAW